MKQFEEPEVTSYSSEELVIETVFTQRISHLQDDI